jgi:NAD(P)-dependent dehydrogenase (short-subunit alcohol dehydrogenase family)
MIYSQVKQSLKRLKTPATLAEQLYLSHNSNLSHLETAAMRIFISTLIVLSTFIAGNSFAEINTDQKTVFITGANRGIGLEFVKQFAERNWNVIATTRKLGSSDDLRALAASDKNITIEQLDVTDFERISELKEKYKDQTFDILLSNAGITPKYKSAFTRANKVDYDMARRSYEVNALAPLHLSSTFMANVAASDNGKIIVISSKGGSFGAKQAEFPMMYSYRSSKAALNMMMYTLAFETPKKGVILAILSPGQVHTAKGPQRKGTIMPDESVSKMLAVIDGLIPENNGQFLNFEDGGIIPW